MMLWAPGWAAVNLNLRVWPLCPQAGQALNSSSWAADVAVNTAGTLVFGFLFPALALAWQEIRCRRVFAGGRKHLLWNFSASA